MSSQNNNNGSCDSECNQPVLVSIWYLLFPMLMIGTFYTLCSAQTNAINQANNANISDSDTVTADRKYEVMI